MKGSRCMNIIKEFCTIVTLLISLSLQATQPAFSTRTLSKKETSKSFGSNNPIKRLLFENRYRAYELSVINPTNTSLYLKSHSWAPQPLQPHDITQKLSQSKSAAPWLLGACWSAALINLLGFAIIPSIVAGCTIIIAGIAGMNNKDLPENTQHTIKNLLIDGIHNYKIPAHDKLKFLIILESKAKNLSIAYSMDNNTAEKTILIPLC